MNAGDSRQVTSHFGLKALFAFVFLCCLQFTLMSYLGTLGGLVVGALVCSAVLGILLIGAIVAPSDKHSDARAAMDRLAIRLTLGVVALIAASIVGGGGHIVLRELATQRVRLTLQRDLGFNFEQRIVTDNNEVVSAFEVTSVKSGGIMQMAGMRRDDLVLTDLTHREFLSTLEENRGRSVQLNVAAGPTLQAIDQLPRRTVTVVIPAR